MRFQPGQKIKCVSTEHTQARFPNANPILPIIGEEYHFHRYMMWEYFGTRFEVLDLVGVDPVFDPEDFVYDSSEIISAYDRAMRSIL